MLKILIPAVGAALIAAPALAQPTPNEQVGMFVGDNATNGSAVIVTDRFGTHPEGYPGMAIINRTSAAKGPTHRHRHHAFVATPINQGR